VPVKSVGSVGVTWISRPDISSSARVSATGGGRAEVRARASRPAGAGASHGSSEDSAPRTRQVRSAERVRKSLGRWGSSAGLPTRLSARLGSRDGAFTTCGTSWTALFRKGVAAPTVQALAGHAHLTTTERYAHVARTDLKAAIARLAG
jgi:integrase